MLKGIPSATDNPEVTDRKPLPTEIDKTSFSSARKGYDKKEVKRYLSDLEASFRDLESWAFQTKERLTAAEQELSAMRATEEDKMAAALQGINPNRVNSIVFFLGFALAAAAGVLMAPIYSVSPSMGAMPLLKAFMVIILGGMGSVHGAAVGALIIGLLDAFLSVSIGIDLAYLVGWGAISVVRSAQAGARDHPRA